MKIKHNDILLRIATQSDAEQIYLLMKQVYEALEDKSLYVCDGFDYVKKHISHNGFTVVACNQQGKIVGSFMIEYPQLSEENLGRDIGMADPAQLQKVVHMDSAVVSADYRGHHLQREMLKYAESCIEADKYQYLMATVSPDNPASFKSFEKSGYQWITTKEKYDGLVRRIYLKNII